MNNLTLKVTGIALYFSMMKKCTSTDIARLCGCSQTTVSRVLNAHPSVDPRTREAVLACARASGYPIRNRHGKLRIGIVFSRESTVDSFQAMALNALKDAIHRHGHRMEIVFNEDLDSLNDHPVSGAIAVTGDATLNRRWAETTILPLIRFGAKGDKANGIYSVFSDESTLVGRAVRELSRAGHRRIALFLRRSRDKDDTLSENVSEPFRRAMKKYLPDEKEILISYGEKDVSPVQRLDLLLKKKITALVVIPGDTVLELCAGIRQRNLRVPDDISIVSREFDRVLEFCDPPVSAMRPDYEAMSEAAVSMLEKALQGRPGALKDRRIPGSFIFRSSIRDLTLPPARSGAGRRRKTRIPAA